MGLMWWTMALMILATAALVLRWLIVRHRSEFVASWHQSSRETLREGRHFGKLLVRTAGDGDTVFLLLHGLGATGLTWGSGLEKLADKGVLFIPDLLGWGGSIDMDRESFTLDEHMNALDEALELAGLGRHHLVIGGHSMGALLALRFAARHVERVDRLVTWGAPMYADINRTIEEMGWMPRLFALDGRPAQLACRLMCAQRNVAARMATISRPDVPGPVAAASVEHTWASYRGSLRSLVIDNDWREPLSVLGEAGVAVELQWGEEDKIGSPSDVESWAANVSSIKVVRVPGYDHHLPFIAASAAADALIAGSGWGQ